jgi:serine/threonine protein phosphatase PrpC
VIKAYGTTDKGRVRARNEDCFTAAEDVQFCVVADGMGGHNAGDVAARLAVETLVDFIREDSGGFGFWPFGFNPSLSEAANRLRTGIHLANQRILETSTESQEYAGMGTTIVAALVEGQKLIVGHVGDSRLYLLREGRLRPLTTDDSWGAVLAQDPSLDPEFVRNHPLRNALTNAVGTRAKTDVHVVEESLADHDVLLLTTDGVHGTLDDERIESLARRNDDVQQLAETLVATALERGSRDNCTALVAQYLPDQQKSDSGSIR